MSRARSFSAELSTAPSSVTFPSRTLASIEFDASWASLLKWLSTAWAISLSLGALQPSANATPHSAPRPNCLLMRILLRSRTSSPGPPPELDPAQAGCLRKARARGGRRWRCAGFLGDSGRCGSRLACRRRAVVSTNAQRSGRAMPATGGVPAAGGALGLRRALRLRHLHLELLGPAAGAFRPPGEPLTGETR